MAAPRSAAASATPTTRSGHQCERLGQTTDGYSARDPKADPSANPDRDPARQDGGTLRIGKTWAPGQRTEVSVMHTDTHSHYDGYNGPTWTTCSTTTLDTSRCESHHALRPPLNSTVDAGQDTLINFNDPTEAHDVIGTARTRLLGVELGLALVDGHSLQVGSRTQRPRAAPN